MRDREILDAADLLSSGSIIPLTPGFVAIENLASGSLPDQTKWNSRRRAHQEHRHRYDEVI